MKPINQPEVIREMEAFLKNPQPHQIVDWKRTNPLTKQEKAESEKALEQAIQNLSSLKKEVAAQAKADAKTKRAKEELLGKVRALSAEATSKKET